MRLISNNSSIVWGRLVLLLALTLSTASAAFARPKPVPHHGRIFIPKMLPTILPDAREGYQTVLRGRASWYGKFFQGMETASGERYDRFQYTCAHKKLPFGTRLRVTNVDNGVTVVVRVSDRGPFRKERILDLSEKAARPLGLVEAGSGAVVAVVVPDDTPLGLADTPTDLAALQAADPRPQAPFTAYLTPLLKQAHQLTEAVAAQVAAGPLAAPATPQQFELGAGVFTDAQLAQAQLARIQTIDPNLVGNVQQLLLNGRPVNQVVIGRLDSWLAAETVRRNLQAWGVVGKVRPAQPEPQPSGGEEPAIATLN